VRIGSLFSGIGGLELGLERAGLGRTAWQVECNPFCLSVLAKHWPDAERFDDVRRCGAHNLSPVEILCGGFPCQDVSQAARGRNPGLDGERSGLWLEFARITEELSPRVVLVENVASGRNRWLPTVRRTLHLLGYRSRAFDVSARECGAPHLRRRIFVVGYADRDGEPALPVDGEVARVPRVAGAMWNGWFSFPDRLRMDDGFPGGVDRIAALGNAVLPQCAETVGLVIRGMVARREEA
jgi:DNA (cytosine-5)-methyltransferase 1